VEHTGPGIAEADEDAAFEPFDRAGARRIEITGLGLSIARQLVDAMGGALQLSSEVGRGSRFWFELPIAAPASLGDELLQPWAAEPQAEA
jgi:signal transduction histidine kinase